VKLVAQLMMGFAVLGGTLTVLETALEIFLDLTPLAQATAE